MKILVTGAKGMVGRALCRQLSNIRDGKNRCHPKLLIEEIYAYDLDSNPKELKQYCKNADFVFHLAGVNRPEDPTEFTEGNVGFTEVLLDTLEEVGSCAGVMMSSSVQATLAGRFSDSAYGKSKRVGEELLFAYAEKTGNRVAVYRFPNLMGHSRPNYNSAVSTFCWAMAHDQPICVHDPKVELELLYIDDLVEAMLKLLEGEEQHCRYEETEAIPEETGKYCYVPGTYRKKLGEIVCLLETFRQQPETRMMPSMTEDSFEKKLYSLYLSYLPKEKMKYALRMNADERGSFTELMHTEDCGQVSVNISKPGITKGQHWHCSKWEQFIVVSGRGLIRERNPETGETVEFAVSGEKMEAVYMIPGWTHSLTNLSETEDLVTIMTCNENFDPKRPDTYFEPV